MSPFIILYRSYPLSLPSEHQPIPCCKQAITFTSVSQAAGATTRCSRLQQCWQRSIPGDKHCI